MSVWVRLHDLSIISMHFRPFRCSRRALDTHEGVRRVSRALDKYGLKSSKSRKSQEREGKDGTERAIERQSSSEQPRYRRLESSETVTATYCLHILVKTAIMWYLFLDQVELVMFVPMEPRKVKGSCSCSCILLVYH